MKKFKTLLLTLGCTSAVALPIAAISCSNQEKPQKQLIVKNDKGLYVTTQDAGTESVDKLVSIFNDLSNFMLSDKKKTTISFSIVAAMNTSTNEEVLKSLPEEQLKMQTSFKELIDKITLAGSFANNKQSQNLLENIVKTITTLPADLLKISINGKNVLATIKDLLTGFKLPTSETNPVNENNIFKNAKIIDGGETTFDLNNFAKSIEKSKKDSEKLISSNLEFKQAEANKENAVLTIKQTLKVKITFDKNLTLEQFSKNLTKAINEFLDSLAPLIQQMPPMLPWGQINIDQLKALVSHYISFNNVEFNDEFSPLDEEQVNALRSLSSLFTGNDFYKLVIE
ncbi:hypothetical protein [Mycoplasma seminis]|uniref:Variable surface lipoprotein n=1 Tax=Mycoplasma seminis TaxID=512749 RepID=A0ABY9HAB0_9MOLU|nr:hypothetical protein [Mycoplasma seminis]WLP85186.1 hypothetical protein Q8852_02585 [Mycoplasma seminis]